MRVLRRPSIARLKANPDLSHVPVIALTGHATHEDIARAISASCTDYLIKPVDYETLIVNHHPPKGGGFALAEWPDNSVLPRTKQRPVT